MEGLMNSAIENFLQPEEKDVLEEAWPHEWREVLGDCKEGPWSSFLKGTLHLQGLTDVLWNGWTQSWSRFEMSISPGFVTNEEHLSILTEAIWTQCPVISRNRMVFSRELG